jgi:hypothetical protein
VEPTDDGDVLAASLADRLATVTFTGQPTDEVTRLLIDAVVHWGREQGWRVYCRAASVTRLPPPYEHQHSYLDVACARAAGKPVVIEIDHTDRRRTVDKLLAEADAGRIPIWVRWGNRAFAAAPQPIHILTVPVTSQRGLHTRLTEMPVPEHSDVGVDDAEQPDLF